MHAMKYEDAMRQLENIVEDMENGELDIDEMGKQLQKAQQLIKLCKEKLTKTNQEIHQILEGNTDKS